ncbi:phage portal protein, partial [Lactobacillus crispatus]
LYSVNFYNIDYGTGERKSFVTVCTADHIYYYEDDSKDANQCLHLVDEEEHYFKGVPVTEFNNNEDRTGAFESVLDNIDAYDLSQSELANFQQ